MRHLTLLLTIGASLSGCTSLDEPSLTSTDALSADRLEAGEALSPGESIGSGSTALVYQDDNNLVLYQGGGAIWATSAGLGAAPDSFAMQGDCNAVVYGADGAVWASGTGGQGSSCSAHVIEGDWFICSGNTRVFTARGGGDCGGGIVDEPPPAPMDLSQMARIGGDGEAVSAYLIHMLQNTEVEVLGNVRTLWDMIDQTKFMVSLGFNGGGTDSYRVFFHYSAEGHGMIANAQFNGHIRYRNADNGSFSPTIGFTQGGPFDPTLAHPNMDHAFKSLFEESGRDLCLQPQWNEGSTVGEIDIDFHRQTEVSDHGRPDNSDPLTTCSGGCKNNNAAFIGAWGSPGGLPGYAGPMTVSDSGRGLVYDFHQQRQLPGYDDVATVLAGRGIGVATGDVAVPR